jgi:hypothetical protein
MWWTPEGERVLTGAEWALFREGLDYCWMWVEETIDHDDDWEFGVQAFDVLQPTQRLAVLANVGIALTDKTVPYPDLTTHDEAAIAAIFRTVLGQIGLEIDCGSDKRWKDPTRMRRLALAAWRELMEYEEAEAQKLTSKPREAGTIPTPPADDREAEDDEDRWKAPAEDCRDLAEWESLLDCLACRILWDDDFNMAEYLMDGDPWESRRLMELMGIDGDYFTAIAPDPTNTELKAIRKQLRKLTGRKRSRKRRQ